MNIFVDSDDISRLQSRCSRIVWRLEKLENFFGAMLARETENC